MQTEEPVITEDTKKEEKELTPRERFLEKIKSLKTDDVNDIVKIVEDSITDKDIEDFEIPLIENIKPEELKYLDESNRTEYTIGAILSNDTEDKLDPIETVKEVADISAIPKDLIDRLNQYKDNEEETKTSKALIKAYFIQNAYANYMNMLQNEYNDKMLNANKMIDPLETTNNYFNDFNKIYGYNPETGEVSKPEIKEGEEDSSYNDMEIREYYKESITLSKLIEIANDKTFNRRLFKKLRKDVRYKRLVDRCNSILTYYIYNKNDVHITKVNELPSIIDRMIVSRNKDLREFNKMTGCNLLNKAIVAALEETTKSININSKEMYRLAFIVTNIKMLNMSGTKDLTGSREQLFKALIKFVMTIRKNQDEYFPICC